MPWSLLNLDKQHFSDARCCHRVATGCACTTSWSQVHASRAELSTKHTFQLQRGKGLPAQLIPYMRLCYCTDESKLADINLNEAGDLTAEDAPVLQQLTAYLQQRLAR